MQIVQMILQTIFLLFTGVVLQLLRLSAIGLKDLEVEILT